MWSRASSFKLSIESRLGGRGFRGDRSGLSQFDRVPFGVVFIARGLFVQWLRFWHSRPVSPAVLVFSGRGLGVQWSRSWCSVVAALRNDVDVEAKYYNRECERLKE